MSLARRCVPYLILLVLMGCASNSPITDFDRDTDFSRYQTFAFISEHPMLRAPDSLVESPLLEPRLMRSTAAALEAKGFRLLDDPEAADITVSFTVGARDKIKTTSYPEPYRPYFSSWGARYYGRYGGVGMGASVGTEVNVQQYVEGTLAIDIYDVAARQPVWHGVSSKRITEKMRRNPDQSVTEAVNAILREFPPSP